MDKLRKQPSESIRFGADFAGALMDGDVLDHVSDIEIVPLTEGGTIPLALAGGISLTDKSASAIFSGGDDGRDYKITWLVTTSTNEVLEHEFVVRVKEL